MKKLFLPPFVLLSLFLSACGINAVAGSGKIISSSRTVSGFSGLVFDVPGELILTQGDDEFLHITGDDNLLDKISTQVVGNNLHISLESGYAWIAPTQPIRFLLSVKTLKQVSLNGSGEITAVDLKTNEFKLTLNGSGKVTFGALKATTLDFDLNGSGDVSADSLSADELWVTLKGSGDYKLKGKINRQSATIIGSGTYDARSVESVKAEISINGSGDGMVQASANIRVSILGSGSVGYIGKAKIAQTIAGSGSVYLLQ